MRRLAAILIAYSAVVALLLFQPATPHLVHAQSNDATPNPYIDALGTQAALNTQATLAAYQQQQAAAAAANAAAQAQAQAVYAAQQATQQAGQQQAALVAAQSTADAAALQATAIVQQTRTAIEFEATRQAVTVAAETTRQALVIQATRAALSAESTQSAAAAQRRDNEAVATSVAMSIKATQTAIASDQQIAVERQANDRRVATTGSLIVLIVLSTVGCVAILLIGKLALRLWRSRVLNPSSAQAASWPVPPSRSAASESVVDSSTGIVSERLAVIEYDDDPAALAEALRQLYGHS